MRPHIPLFLTLILMATVLQPVLAMDSYLFGGYYNLLSPTTQEFNSLSDGYEWTLTEAWRTNLISTDGVLKNLQVRLSGAPSVGSSYNFSVRVNESDSVLYVVIQDGETQGSNLIDNVSIGRWDRVTLGCDPTNSPDAVYATWSSMFVGDNPNESMIFQTNAWGLNPDAVEYQSLSGAGSPGAETGYRQIIPTDGNLTNMVVLLSQDPGGADDAYNFTLRVNGFDTALSVMIQEPDVTGGDFDNVSVVAGDIVTYKIEPINVPLRAPNAKLGLTFRADQDGESIVLGSTVNNLDTALTEYIEITPGWYGQLWTVTEAERYSLGGNCTIKNFHLLLQSAPGAGNKFDFIIRVGGADSDLNLTISGLDTSGDSGTLIDGLTDFEYVTLKVVPDSSPTVGDTHWGLVIDTGVPGPPFNPPTMPTLLYGAGFNGSVGYGFVELYWVNGTYVDDYEIQNSTDNISWDHLALANSTSYNDTSVELVNGTIRYYRVRSRGWNDDHWANSSWSDVNLERVNFTSGGPGAVSVATVSTAPYLAMSIILLMLGLILGMVIKR